MNISSAFLHFSIIHKPPVRQDTAVAAACALFLSPPPLPHLADETELPDHDSAASTTPETKCRRRRRSRRPAPARGAHALLYCSSVFCSCARDTQRLAGREEVHGLPIAEQRQSLSGSINQTFRLGPSKQKTRAVKRFYLLTTEE